MCVKNIPGAFLDKLEEGVVLVVHNHHNQEILRHKLKYLRHCHNKKIVIRAQALGVGSVVLLNKNFIHTLCPNYFHYHICMNMLSHKIYIPANDCPWNLLATLRPALRNISVQDLSRRQIKVTQVLW